MKIVIVYGTRPEIIKLVPLILKLREQQAIQLILVSTGQHRELVNEVEQLFDIIPDFSLNIMQHDQTLTDILGNVATRIEPVLKSLDPDIVLIQGDTTTVAAVGTVCFYNKIPIGHIEAGLRSYNLEEPFPEEFNRRIISIIADFNFAPTPQSANNLSKEGISSDKIFVTGNTIVDMVQLIRKKISYGKGRTVKKILVTAHRRENHGQGIYNVCSAIKQVCEKFPDVIFTWPVHPNPNVKDMVYKELSGLKNVILTSPLNYVALVKELDESYIVWSDSGGIQEECPSFKKPVLILRNITERPEVVASGFGELVGTDTDCIVRKTSELLSSDQSYRKMIQGKNPFGDGIASEQIINILLHRLKQK